MTTIFSSMVSLQETDFMEDLSQGLASSLYNLISKQF